MADLSEAIYSRLTGDATVASLVSTRVYPVTPRHNQEKPYITYAVVSMLPRPHVMGSDPALTTDRVQVDMWCATYAQMVALDDAVMAVLSRWRGTEASVVIQSSFHVSRRDLYESEPEVYRRSIDFEISWEEQ